MMYVHEPSMKQLRKDVEAFYKSTLKSDEVRLELASQSDAARSTHAPVKILRSPSSLRMAACCTR